MKNNNEAEIVAVRRTFDGVTVNFHANGEVSFVQYFLRGRLPASHIWRVADDVCLYEAAELPALIRRVSGRACGEPWRPFRVIVPTPASAVYTSIRCANGMETLIRLARLAR